MLRKVRFVAHVTLAFLAAFVAAAWGREAPELRATGDSDAPRSADQRAAARRPEWARADVAAGPPTPGRVLRSSRGAKSVPVGLDDSDRVAAETRAQDGSSYGVFARRFNPTGTALTGDVQVNTYTTSAQTVPDVASDKKGNFVVMWQSTVQDGSSYGVFGRRFNSAAGATTPEFAVNSFTTGSQSIPSIGLDKKGNPFVVWSSDGQDGDSYGIVRRRFDATGSPLVPEFVANEFTTGLQGPAEVALDKKGNAVAVWRSYSDGDASGIAARRFDATGAPAGPEFAVNGYTTGVQIRPHVAVGAKGSFVVVWMSDGPDGDGRGVFGRRFDATGTPLGGDLALNTFTTGDQDNPAVVLDTKGNFAVVWDSAAQDGDGYGVFGRRFDVTGTPLGGVFAVNTFTTGTQGAAGVVVDKKGNLVVAWQGENEDGDGYGIFGRRFDATGAALGAEFTVNAYTTGQQRGPSLAIDGKGNFVVVWQSS